LNPEAKAIPRRSNRLHKAARDLSRTIAELWDEPNPGTEQFVPPHVDRMDDMPIIEYMQGTVVLDQSLRIGSGTKFTPPPKTSMLILHSMVALQLLSVSARVLQARFASTLLYTLYPILQSIISSVSQLSDSGFTALNIVASCLSYASPAN
jgi:hypothetical protein